MSWGNKVNRVLGAGVLLLLTTIACASCVALDDPAAPFDDEPELVLACSAGTSVTIKTASSLSGSERTEHAAPAVFLLHYRSCFRPAKILARHPLQNIFCTFLI